MEPSGKKGVGNKPGYARNKIKFLMRILKNPNLLGIILDEINKKVVGEKETIKAIIINGCGIWAINHQIASYNLHLNDAPGVGKDFVMTSTLNIFPQSNVVYRTKLTPQVLAYWHQDDPGWTWDNKILYIEDISNDLLASDVFKTMASSGSHATVLIKQKPVDIKIIGKPVIMITSYKTFPNDENLRRFPILGCNETADQTLKIMQKQAQDAMTGEETFYDDEIKEALSLLAPCKVRIPFADNIPQNFPRNRYMRTHFYRFLDLIKASTALHQFQRKKKDGYILANLDDYKIARDVMLKTTSNTEMIPLTRIQKEILNFLRDNNGRHSIPDMAKHLPNTDKTLRLNSDKLVSHGLLKRDTSTRDTSTKPVRVYWYDKPELELEIPKVLTILPKIPKVLDSKSTDKEHGVIGEKKDNNIGNIGNNGIINKINNNSIIDSFSIFGNFAIGLKKIGFSENQVSILSKIFKGMVENPSVEWSLGKVSNKIGMTPSTIKTLLMKLTSNPYNPTPIRMKDERGDSYILDGRELDKWRDSGGIGSVYDGHKSDKELKKCI